MATPDIAAMLSLGELRTAMEARGVEFSDSQLKRLRREGLLPVEGQQHRGGVRGSESLYPGWAVDQLALVAQQQRGERRFAQLRVLVRWHGGWVRPDKLRASLIGWLEAVSSYARRLTADTVDETDRADRLAAAMTRRPGQSGVSRLMRERLNHVADDIQRAAYAFAALATRSPVEWHNHDPSDASESLLDVFERASGFDRARRDDISGHGPLLGDDESSEKIIGELQQTGLFDILDLGAAFRIASDEAIDRAFDDAIALAGPREAFDAIQSLVGHDVAGLGSVSELGAAEQAIDLAVLVRALLLLRPLMDDGALETIVDAATAAGPQLRAARQLAEALPHLARYLRPRGPERLAALGADDRERVTGEVRRYLELHPELATMLEKPHGGADAPAHADRHRARAATR